MCGFKKRFIFFTMSSDVPHVVFLGARSPMKAMLGLLWRVRVLMEENRNDYLLS